MSVVCQKKIDIYKYCSSNKVMEKVLVIIEIQDKFRYAINDTNLIEMLENKLNTITNVTNIKPKNKKYIQEITKNINNDENKNRVILSQVRISTNTDKEINRLISNFRNNLKNKINLELISTLDTQHLTDIEIRRMEDIDKNIDNYVNNLIQNSKIAIPYRYRKKIIVIISTMLITPFLINLNTNQQF